MVRLSITPKLVVADADAAIRFYQEAFAADLMQRYVADGRVVVAELLIGEATVLLKDGDEVDPAPAAQDRCPVLLDIVTDEPDALAAAFVQAGGEVVFPVADQPYGARQGRVRDPFGHEWIVGSANTMTPEQVQAALTDG